MAEKNFKIQNGLLVLEDSQFNDNITVNGSVTASSFIGDGSGLTGVGVDVAGIASSSAAIVSEANSYTDSQISGLDLDFTSELVAASAAAVTSANSYTDSEISGLDLDFTSELVSASAAAVISANSYTDSELLTIDLSSTIQTASAAAVNYLIDSAPGTLDTLNELSAALNDDPNFYSTIASVYLTQSNASSIYLTQSSASTTYEKLIPYSSSTPSSPVTGDMWVDSTTTPPALKVYNGSSWVQLGAAVDDSQAIIAGRVFS